MCTYEPSCPTPAVPAGHHTSPLNRLGLGAYPGGHPIVRPPSTCRCRWYTLWHPSLPSLTTTRKPPSAMPAALATADAVDMRWPRSAESSGVARDSCEMGFLGTVGNHKHETNSGENRVRRSLVPQP